MCVLALLCVILTHLAAAPHAAQDAEKSRQSMPAAEARSNDLRRIEDGGFIVDWLISSPQPSEVSAGAYENLQRFNIERLPEIDWLAQFGGASRITPRPGVMRATVSQSTQTLPDSKETAAKPRADVPEAGAVAATQIAQASDTIEWRTHQATSPRLDFAALNNAADGARPVGTAYAAAYIKSSEPAALFIETDGFLGSLHLNGEQVYDGFRLDPPRVMLVRLRAGTNLLLLRATGVTGDYWRKDGGWTAMLRLWRARAAGDKVLAGALRSDASFVDDSEAKTSEVLRLTVANRGREAAHNLKIKLDANDATAAATIDRLAGGELRDIELRLPLGVKPNAETAARIRITTPDGDATWMPVWTPAPLSPAGTIFYLEGFHVDPVYLHDQRGYARITLSNTNQYMRSLRADKSYGVFLSEIDYLKPYDDTHPEDRALLRDAIREGRVGTGGSYNQFNELTIGGESIIRNILYGKAYHTGVLGDTPRALALWDVFGHAPQLSQIARKSGFTGVVWSKKIPGFPPFFYDYALDGSPLLHRRLDYAYSFSGFGSGKNYALDAFRRTTETKFDEARSYNSEVDLRINAADFTPPWTNLAGNVERLAENRPRIITTGQAQTRYFDQLHKEIESGKVAPPVTSRDKLFFHVGVAAARSDLKIAHRHAENMTLNAERFGALAHTRGARYPDFALDKAWRQILFGSHHDAITGTPSDNALLDLVHGYREAYELSRGALDDSLRFITSQIDTRPPPTIDSRDANTTPLVIFNPMSWTRTDTVRTQIEFKSPVGFDSDFIVRDAQGSVVRSNRLSSTLQNPGAPDGGIVKTEIEFVAPDVPSLGYKTFYVQPIKRRTTPAPLTTSSDTIENEFYRVTIDPARGGAIKSIYDKQAARGIVRTDGGHLANEIAALEEELTKKNVIYPAWEFWTTGKREFSISARATTKTETHGATRRIIVEGAMPNMRGYRQTISLHAGVRRIDLRTELINYTGQNELFVVNFPLALRDAALVTEDRFGTVTRNNSKGFLDFRSNTDKLVSGAPVYSAYNWVEAGASLTLDFTDDKGAPVARVPLRPAALIRPHGAAHEAMTAQIVSALIREGVSCTPFYDDDDKPRRVKLKIEDSTMPRTLNDDISYHSFRIALGHSSANSYTRKLLDKLPPQTRTGFEQRLAREGFAYLFAFDADVPAGWQPVPVLVVAGNDDASTARALETLLASLAQGDHKLRLPADSIADPRTLPHTPAPDYGVALINNGTIAASLERPDTLTMFLTHTAPFPGVNLDFAFTPEHKTHVFDYAIYPHAKDWRAAHTTRAGYDFNNPLIARQVDGHAGTLAPTHSFLTIDNPNVVLSALKAGGNPQATFRSNQSEGARGLIARLYETTGRAAPARITLSEPLANVQRTDLLEAPIEAIKSNDKTFDFTIDNFGIETFGITLANQPALSSTAAMLGRTTESVQPVPSRYWLHNAGAAPLGNDPIKITVRPIEQMGALSSFAYDDKYNQGGTSTTAVRIQIVNNHLDRRARGTAVLEVPDGWRVVPERIAYDIEPGGFSTTDAIVVTYPVKQGDTWQRASGLIKARTEHGGQIYQDVLQIGKPFALVWQVARGTDEAGRRGISVRITNPHHQRIEGALALITPPEMWATGANSPPPIAPREQGFAVEPRGERTLFFPIQSAQQTSWMIARIAYNGVVEYKRADAVTPDE